MGRTCPRCNMDYSVLRLKKTCKSCNDSICTFCSDKTSGKRICNHCEWSLKPAETVSQLIAPSNKLPADSETLLNEALKNARVSFKGNQHAGVLVVHLVGAKGLIGMDKNLFGQKWTSDPYCVVSIEQEHYSVKTDFIKSTLNPTWDTLFEINLKFPAPVLTFTIYDYDKRSKDDYLGRVVVNLATAVSGKVYVGWFPVKNAEVKGAGMIKAAFAIHYDPISIMIGLYRKNLFINNGYADKPRFDVQEMYVYAYYISDSLGTRLTLPAVNALCDILLWKNYYTSVICLFLWYPVSYYWQLWPSAAFLGAFMWMWMSYSRKPWGRRFAEYLDAVLGAPKATGSIQMASILIGAQQEISVSSWLSIAGRYAPSWIKDACAKNLSLLRATASFFLWLENLVKWKHKFSHILSKGLLAAAFLALIFPTRYLIYTTGLVVLLLLSPTVSSIIWGVVDYFEMDKADGSGIKVRSDFDYSLLSEQALSMKVCIWLVLTITD
jgi:C2 domain